LSKSNIDRKTTLTKYIIVPANLSQYYIARGGFYNYRNTFLASEHNGIVASDSLEFGGINQPNGFTVMRTSGFYTGVSRKIVRDLVVDVKGINRKVYSDTELFADIIFANPKLDPFDYNEKSYPITKGYETKSFGWRLGYKTTLSTGKRWFQLNMRASIGKSPGLQNQKINIFLGSGFTISL
jgi:hypothetical protein